MRRTLSTPVELLELLKRRGTVPQPEPVKLSGSMITQIYLDVPQCLADGHGLRVAANALNFDLMRDGIWPHMTAIGGPAMGAYPLAISVANRNHHMRWFTVRSTLKDHGIIKWIEGSPLTELDRVVLTDDVVSTGNSMLKAYQRVVETGAQVLCIMPLVDRGDSALELLRCNDIRVPYRPLLTYKDLGIDPLVFA